MSALRQEFDYTPAIMQLNRLTVACSFQKHLHDVGLLKGKQSVSFPFGVRKLEKGGKTKHFNSVVRLYVRYFIIIVS